MGNKFYASRRIESVSYNVAERPDGTRYWKAQSLGLDGCVIFDNPDEATRVALQMKEDS